MEVIVEKRRLKENKYYNPDMHDKHKKEWTMSEIKLLKEDNIHTLVELGDLLGRSPAAICQKRSQLRRGLI
jgi:hypothetical protein